MMLDFYVMTVPICLSAQIEIMYTYFSFQNNIMKMYKFLICLFVCAVMAQNIYWYMLFLVFDIIFFIYHNA